ncbi:MAG TPA: ATP-binding protein [Anaerolineales bacterium]|jgi:PAS domain S-box-containing protein
MLPDFRVRQRDYLLEITRTISQELDLQKVLKRILRISIEMLAGQAGLIALKEATSWKVAAAQGIPAAFLRYLEPLLAEERASGLDVVELNRMLKDLAYTASQGLLNGTAISLVTHGQVIGVIFIFRSYTDLFSKNDQQLLQSFADQAAIAVFNARLYSQVIIEKQRLDALIDSAADGIIILNPDHSIERVNDAFERISGQTDEQVRGKGHNEVITWAHKPDGLTLELAEANGWPLTSSAHLYVEGDLKRAEPPNVPVGITYAPLLTPEGQVRNIIVTVHDITHFRNADEIKATFISIVSHELKTPVALIKGYASTLRRDDARWDKHVIQDSLAVIEEEADHLTHMIEDLLDASRLQAGGLTLSRTDFSLPALAARLAERFQTQTKKHALVVDFPQDFPVILADETRINQVLTNLISNAIKYSPGGTISISGEVRPENVIITVDDEGPGIDPHDMPHIFDRFYRSDKAVRKTKGAGLGLFLARAIVEAHGGRIWIDSKPGHGARIRFSLPTDTFKVK